MRKKAGKRRDRVDLAGSGGWGGPVRMRAGEAGTGIGTGEERGSDGQVRNGGGETGRAVGQGVGGSGGKRGRVEGEVRMKAGKRGDRVDLAGSEGWGGPVEEADWERPGLGLGGTGEERGSDGPMRGWRGE